MALLINVDGVVERRMASGAKWTLVELQELVGGYIELMPSVAPMRMLFDEDGVSKELPFNEVATSMVLDALAGQELRYLPVIVGPALVLMEDDEW